MANTPSPPVQLSPSREYGAAMSTVYKSVTFYVRDEQSFNMRYPLGTVDRKRLEGQVPLSSRVVCLLAAAPSCLTKLTQPARTAGAGRSCM